MKYNVGNYVWDRFTNSICIIKSINTKTGKYSLVRADDTNISFTRCEENISLFERSKNRLKI